MIISPHVTRASVPMSPVSEVIRLIVAGTFAASLLVPTLASQASAQAIEDGYNATVDGKGNIRVPDVDYQAKWQLLLQLPQTAQQGVDLVSLGMSPPATFNSLAGNVLHQIRDRYVPQYTKVLSAVGSIITKWRGSSFRHAFHGPL